MGCRGGVLTKQSRHLQYESHRKELAKTKVVINLSKRCFGRASPVTRQRTVKVQPNCGCKPRERKPGECKGLSGAPLRDIISSAESPTNMGSSSASRGTEGETTGES